MEKQVKFTALLDTKLYERVRRLSFENRVSISWIIRKALAGFFLRKDLKEVFEREAKNEKTS